MSGQDLSRTCPAVNQAISVELDNNWQIEHVNSWEQLIQPTRAKTKQVIIKTNKYQERKQQNNHPPPRSVIGATSTRMRDEIETKLKWKRLDTEVQTAGNQNETELNSKWRRTCGDIKVETKWHRSEIDIQWKWIRI